MDFLDAISTLFGYIAFAGLALWSLIHFYDLVVLSGRLKEIRKTESKISYSKLDLKSKIASRIKKISNATNLPAETKKEILLFYQRMANLDFSNVNHYQQLFNELKAVTPLLDLTPTGELEIINQKSINSDLATATEEVAQFDNTFENPFFWQKIYKYETRMVRAVYAIAVLTTEQRALIEQYNHQLRSKRRALAMPQPLTFECFEILWKIVMDEDKAAVAAAVIVDPVMPDAA